MTQTDKPVGKNGLFLRNLISGLIGLGSAIAFTVFAIHNRDSIDLRLLAFSVYIFPLPVAIGLGVGLVAPRKAILWAPLWSCILTVLADSIISGTIVSDSMDHSSKQILFMAAGVVLAGLAATAGEFFNKRNYAWQSTVLVVIVCIGMTFAVRWSAFECERAFEQTHLPVIIRTLNRDYIEAPVNLDWHFKRNSRMGIYSLHSSLGGHPLTVLASIKDYKILGLEYEVEGTGCNIKDTDEAKSYLTSLGFRKKLLSSLAMQSGARMLWCASLEGTSLTLMSTGDVKLEAVKEPVKSHRLQPR